MSSSSSIQLLSISTVAISVTAALYILYQKTCRNESGSHQGRKRRGGLWDGRAIWRQMREVLVVRNAEECEKAVQKLRLATDKVKVLGLDCEWCTKSGKANRVALLQLAAANGLCVLVQLCHMDEIPQSLKDLLADRSILKLGVATLDDANKLINHFDIPTSGCVDLRHLVDRHLGHDLRRRCHGAGLSRLAQILLGVTLSKSYRIRCSNWEAFQLSWQQMQYAIHDAFVAVAIFFEIVNHKIRFSGTELDSIIWTSVVPLCQGIVDIQYKFKPKKSNMFLNEGEDGPASSSSARGYRSGPTKSNKPSQPVKYCKLLFPDGSYMSSCSQKKADWYISKDLGVMVRKEPFTVRLNFQPEGTGFYEEKRQRWREGNKCVVCGLENTQNKKNIVPQEYKKFFPKITKSHSSHDVLLLCPPCDEACVKEDFILQERLAHEYNAPMITSANPAQATGIDRNQLRSHARGLLRHLKKKTLPQEKVQELEKTIKDFYNVEEVTKELLEEAAQAQNKKASKFVRGCHGEKVVTAIVEQEGCRGILNFERRWREHFLKSMRPNFLPKLWSVDYVHKRVAERMKGVESVEDVENELESDEGACSAAL